MVSRVKPSIVTALIATLCVGIAIGWLARPMYGPPAEKTAGEAARVAPSASVAGSATDRPAKTDRERPADDGAKHKPGAPPDDMMVKMRSLSMARHRTSMEQHLSALQESLNLSPAQREKLQAEIEAQVALIDKVMGTPPGEAVDIDPAQTFGIGRLEESLAGSLTPDQEAGLAVFKEREKARKIDARALKDLSRLQGIVDFKEGQREEVYRILSESAGTALANPEPVSVFSEIHSQGVGVETDPYGLGLQKILRDAMNPANGAAGGKESARKIREAVDLSIEEKVEKLRPVLDETQLQRYRTELKNQGLGLLSGMLMGMEE